MEEDAPVLLDIESSDNEAPSLLLDLQEPNISSVPITIICGFLGAGKSTLIRRILTENHGWRIAVIMNEFGDTADIEAKTINVTSAEDPTGDSSEQYLELANGCLCCSIKDAGVAAIEKMMSRMGRYDRILLETTGLADPGPIASIFWQNEEYAMGLGKDIHLDGVVCVVDAVFGQQQIQEDHSFDGVGESIKQIAGSDVVLLNKVDLVPLSQVETTEELIRKINPTVVINRTVKADIDLKYIMGIDAYAARKIPSLASKKDHDDHIHHDGCEHEYQEPKYHYEVRGISSLQVSCPPISGLMMEKLDEWIRTVLWEGHLPGDRPLKEDDMDAITVLRCKGLFFVKGEPYVLQGVRNLYDISRLEGEEVGLPDEGKLVFIGKGLDDRVRGSLNNVLRG